MSDQKHFGTPSKPLAIKCASVGIPEPNKPYLSIVTMDGREFTFAPTFGICRLLGAQLSEAAISWPAETS